jgi:uncharacterized protein (TIGR03118 family)
VYPGDTDDKGDIRMSKSMPRMRALLVAAALATAVLVAAAGAAARSAAPNSFAVTNLVSDQDGMAAHTDTHLVNAWGLAASATSPWWVADNGADVSTLYDATGTPFPAASPLVVGVPGAPTGVVAAPGSGFVVGTDAQAGPARFLFSTEGGQILGWHGGLATAILGVDMSDDGAVFKGLAIAGDRLYVTDFHNDAVYIFDSMWRRLDIPYAFVDFHTPIGFAPFGIQAIGDAIYVTFAKQDEDKKDDVQGKGLGFIDKFDLNGQFISRVWSGGTLNAPWGLALAPDGFGKFGGDLLVGNFGNGKIHAFKPTDSSYTTFDKDGTLKQSDGSPVQIDGLWALEFGMGSTNNGPTSTLFFTAGPNDEGHGLFGSITQSG